MSQPSTEGRGARRVIQGVVVSDRMDKTITVLVERQVQHPIYKKYMRRSTKYHAHDESNDAKAGDLVEIQESRPLSKTKTWVVTRLLQRAVAI